MLRTTISPDVIDNESPRIEQPDTISLQLKPHQLAALYRMKEMDVNCGYTDNEKTVSSNVGIFGDLPGSGKTITMISLISITKDMPRKHFPSVRTNIAIDAYGIVSSRRYEEKVSDYSNTTLIVVPENMVSHWELHLEKYSVLNWETVTLKNMNEIAPECLDVILVSAAIYNRYIDNILDTTIRAMTEDEINDLVGGCLRFDLKRTVSRNLQWNRVVFDEAHSINIPNTSMVYSRYMWLITSTYLRMQLRKNNGFLKDMFKSSYSGNVVKIFYKDVVIESSTDFIRESFKLEAPEYISVDCRLTEALSMIRGFVNQNVINLINAGDLESAVLELGGSVETDDSIIDLITKNFNNTVIDLESRIEMLKKLEMSDDERKKKTQDLEEKLKSAVERKNSLISSIKDVSKKNCLICLENLESPTMIDCCKNLFCAECIIEWMKCRNNCPLCRSAVDVKKLVTVGETVKKPVVVEKLTKTETVVDIIKKNPGRFIIFSDYDFKLLSKTLSSKGIDNDCMSYSSPEKTSRILKKFREKKINVILLNSKNNGAGLEIPEATDIILMHRLPQDLETQTVGRAYRPGRIGGLKIWRLKYPEEYEE